jgi:hypothetical protein
MTKKTTFDCANPECSRSPEKGDQITRVSPKGGPFVGLCNEHYPQFRPEASTR